jgi:hypothetical protein
VAVRSTTFRVDGLRELLRVTDQLPKEVKRDVRNELRRVAEPVRDSATQLFLSNVSSDARKTRYGISVRKVGTITVEQRRKGTSGRKSAKRPKFTDLVMERSLAPALERNEGEIVAGFNRVLDHLERKWAVG